MNQNQTDHELAELKAMVAKLKDELHELHRNVFKICEATYTEPQTFRERLHYFIFQIKPHHRCIRVHGHEESSALHISTSGRFFTL